MTAFRSSNNTTRESSSLVRILWPLSIVLIVIWLAFAATVWYEAVDAAHQLHDSDRYRFGIAICR
jgi:hypothetical protein